LGKKAFDTGRFWYVRKRDINWNT